MHGEFAPMSTDIVRFAKDYRAEQIRAAEKSRLAAQRRRSHDAPGHHN